MSEYELDPNDTRRAIKLFAQAHIEKKKLLKETRAERGDQNKELQKLKSHLLEQLSRSESNAMTWNTDNSSGIVKLKTNNSKRKLNETHVRDVFEDLEEVDIYDCLAGETFEIKIAAIAERITKSVVAARTVTTTTADVKVGPLKRQPKNAANASDSIIETAQKINTIVNTLAEITKNHKEKITLLEEKIRQNSCIIENMLKSQNSTTQKINVKDENDKSDTYFIRLKPVTNKKETPRGISSERFHEVLVNVLKEILSQDSGNEEYVRSFMENREAIINLMITNCIECKTKEDEKQETDEGDDVTQENIFKLSFDKSTGRKRTRSEAS